MKVVILAGGLGSRLSEETVLRPKPMVEIGGRPILWHIMKLYSHHGLTDFVICLGYKGHMIKEFFANYEDFWADLNTMVQESGENLLDDPKGLSKARQMFESMTGYYPENPGGWLMLALAQYKSNLAKEGDLSVAAFDKAVAAAGDIGTLPKDQKKLLKNALIRYADHLVSKGQRDRAKKYAAIGRDHFMEEADFKGMWESL